MDRTMTATPAPVWKSLRACPADLLALSHPQANHSQSQGCRGEVSEGSQHLIGDVLTDWMTEEVDFSSYLPNPPSPPSSTNASLPPSPLQNDIHVPSDLEVMTSLLQEELAQLEDYFLSEPLPEKGPRLGRCDRASLLTGPQPYSQLPCASYSAPNQSESSPFLLTLASGEVDLLGVCAGPVGRSKIPRYTPYSCGRPSPCARKRIPDGVRLGEGYDHSSSSKGINSGNSSLSYCCVEEEQLAGYCLGGAVELRKCGVLAKEDKNCRFNHNAVGNAKAATAAGGFHFAASLHDPPKKEDLLMYSMREVSSGAANSEVLSGVKTGAEVPKATVSWKAQSSDSCSYLSGTPQSETYHGFFTEQVKAENLQIGQHDLHCNFLEDPGPECLLMARDSLNLESCRLKEDHCAVKYEFDVIPAEGGGERKQKKRDQNKTAAHRYRQRKRAELDSLEEQLHCLEVRNRELRDKAESVEREIQYVKDLLIEVYKARSQRLKQDATG
ncbi:uncharacterized protein LOC127588709 isoform X1 [Hippocampus zosterae]|uniref:uncharacterized protein LOC127588709 isoform X1 n=2 Tax=Hippocampus zosterae TaxID=109293 RepID=UPI00223D2DD9|nr:uncharacterized protein LOC127588709 isoform X1 [Hippocampus zosterae]